MWKQRGSIPAEWCPSIERYTRELGRPIPCERLNPQVEWYVLRATPVIRRKRKHLPSMIGAEGAPEPQAEQGV